MAAEDAQRTPHAGEPDTLLTTLSVPILSSQVSIQWQKKEPSKYFLEADINNGNVLTYSHSTHSRVE